MDYIATKQLDDYLTNVLPVVICCCAWVDDKEHLQVDYQPRYFIDTA